MCPEGQSIVDANFVVHTFADYGLNPSACGDTARSSIFFPQDSSPCEFLQTVGAFQCGCVDDFLYMNAKSKTQTAILAWMPRISGPLSVFGSFYIIVDIFKRTGTLTVYQELMLFMSAFDVISSVAIMFSTLPIPEFNGYGEPSGIYGARGNDATCKTQGFFIQLGYTGTYYNLALSIYYLLVIKYGWREARIRSISKWFHLPLLVGVPLAFAGISLYGSVTTHCYILSPPFANGFGAISVFLIGPISLVILGATINMLMVYCEVRRVDRVGNKWRMFSSVHSSSATKKKLENAIFWQSVFYLGALYLSWPILLVSNFSSLYKGSLYFPYAHWVVATFLCPLQGFSNFVVYARPRLLSRYRKKQRRNGSKLPHGQNRDELCPSDEILTGGFRSADVLKTKQGKVDETEPTETILQPSCI